VSEQSKHDWMAIEATPCRWCRLCGALDRGRQPHSTEPYQMASGIPGAKLRSSEEPPCAPRVSREDLDALMEEAERVQVRVERTEQRLRGMESAMKGTGH
jgi:hypothetical protein